VVFFDRALAAEFDYRCKQAGQLAAKMRFLAAPWVGMLRSGAWLERARHANAMAKRLEGLLSPLPALAIVHPVLANSVFVRFPPGVADRLRARGWRFYDFIAGLGSRLMCAWDTREEELVAFAKDLEGELARP